MRYEIISTIKEIYTFLAATSVHQIYPPSPSPIAFLRSISTSVQRWWFFYFYLNAPRFLNFHPPPFSLFPTKPYISFFVSFFWCYTIFFPRHFFFFLLIFFFLFANDSSAERFEIREISTPFFLCFFFNSWMPNVFARANSYRYPPSFPSLASKHDQWLRHFDCRIPRERALSFTHHFILEIICMQ